MSKTLDVDLSNDLPLKIHNMVQNSEKLKMFEGTCEKDGEPDYELLRKHIEVWVQTHPKEAAEFYEYKQETMKENFKKTGASESLSMRNLGALPPGLFQLLAILSPNFLGQNEISPDAKHKRVRKFFKKFPAFKMCEKI